MISTDTNRSIALRRTVSDPGIKRAENPTLSKRSSSADTIVGQDMTDMHEVLGGLARYARTYGGDTLKVEPPPIHEPEDLIPMSYQDRILRAEHFEHRQAPLLPGKALERPKIPSPMASAPVKHKSLRKPVSVPMTKHKVEQVWTFEKLREKQLINQPRENAGQTKLNNARELLNGDIAKYNAERNQTAVSTLQLSRTRATRPSPLMEYVLVNRYK
jgi:hypothetical protein